MLTILLMVPFTPTGRSLWTARTGQRLHATLSQVLRNFIFYTPQALQGNQKALSEIKVVLQLGLTIA